MVIHCGCSVRVLLIVIEICWGLYIYHRFTMGTSMVMFLLHVNQIDLSLSLNQLTTCSRQIFAFSRDGGLPLSKWLYNVNKRFHAPVNAVWFSVIISFLLGLLSFAGPSAIGAVFSLVVAGQYVAYSIPIAARFIGGRNIQPGPFNLGKLVRSCYSSGSTEYYTYDG